jgi:hypothetical protein
MEIDWLPRARSVGLAAFAFGKSFSPGPVGSNPQLNSVVEV